MDCNLNAIYLWEFQARECSYDLNAKGKSTNVEPAECKAWGLWCKWKVVESGKPLKRPPPREPRGNWKYQ